MKRPPVRNQTLGSRGSEKEEEEEGEDREGRRLWHKQEKVCSFLLVRESPSLSSAGGLYVSQL